MATDKNFVIKNGLTVGTTEIIDSSGNLVNSSGSISGTTITGSDRGTFEDLVLTGDADDDLTFTVNAGDWSILNSQQSNGLVIYDGTAGVQLIYNNQSRLEVLTGGLNVVNGTLSIAGTEFADASRNVTAGTISSGAIAITSADVPLSFVESGHTGNGQYWRMPLDGGNLRFDVSLTGGSSFTTYDNILQLNSDGSINVQGAQMFDSSGNISTTKTINSGAITSSGSSQVANLTVTGDLTVQGTTVTIDAATLNVEDKNITLNYSTGDSSGSADGAGITIQDAVNSTTDATILWDATNDKFEFSNNISLPFATASISFGGSTLGGPHGLIFNDDDGTSSFSMFYRTTPQTITFEIEGDVAKHTFERDGSYTNTGDINVGGLLVMAGGSGNPISFIGTGSDTNARNFAYEASGHHYVTNRHTSGDLVLMSNNGTGGSETARITLKAGSGTQDIDITNANLDLNSNNITNVGTISSGYIAVTSDTDSYIRSSTDNDNKFTFVNNASADYAQLILDGNDGGGEKFIIGYGSTHANTPNMLALKSNDATAGAIGFFTNGIERSRIDPSGYFEKQTSENNGYIVGGYNSITGNNSKANPIYAIGSAYTPSTETENGTSFYGIGFTRASAGGASYFQGLGFAERTGWGLYGAAAGVERWFLDASNGDINYVGELVHNDTVVIDSSRNLTNIGTISSGDIKIGSGGAASLGEAALCINVTNKPQLLLDGGNDAYPDIVVPTGEVLQIAHWDVSANSSSMDLSIETDGDVTIERGAINMGSNEVISSSRAISATTIDATGQITTDTTIQSGDGSGGVALTINDGYGNANVTWNHLAGTPEQNGNAARIEVNTDATSGATMDFEVLSNVTSGTAVDLDHILSINETGLLINSGHIIYSSGTLELRASDVDFVVSDTTDSTQNFIWRDWSAAKLYLGTGNAVATLRSTLDLNSNGITNAGNIDSTGTIRQIVNNVGIPTVYGQHTMEATDAQLDLVSSSAGTWGSAINFVEGASTSANTDVWSIARKTTGGAGDSSLNFNFGTANQHDNTNRVAFSSGGNITLTGTVDGRDVAADGTKLDTIATNADVTPSWVPSSDPGYLTSSSTQSKYLRSDTSDTFSGGTLTIQAPTDGTGVFITKAVDSPDEPAALVIASDADAEDDLAFEIRGNATGSSVDLSTTMSSTDTTFAVFANGHTTIGYSSLGTGYTPVNSYGLNVNGTISSVSGYYAGSTQAINSSGVYVGTLTSSQVTTALGYTPYQESTALSATTGDFSGIITCTGNNMKMSNVGARVKYSVWSTNTYGIGMETGYTYGGIDNNYVMSFQMSDTTGRGFWWGDSSHTNAQGAMALTTDGYLTVANGVRIGYGETDTTTPGAGIDVRTTADASPAIIATNTGGVGSTIQRWVGSTGAFELGEISGEDYSLLNKEQNNGFVIYNASGGVDVYYNGSAVQSWDSSGGTIINTGDLAVAGSTSAEAAIKTTNGRLTLGPHTSGAGMWLGDSGNATARAFLGLSNNTAATLRYYVGGNKWTMDASGNSTQTGTASATALQVSGTTVVNSSKQIENVVKATINGTQNSGGQTTLLQLVHQYGGDQLAAMTADIDFHLWDSNTVPNNPQARIGATGDGTANQNYEAGGKLSFYTAARSHPANTLSKVGEVDHDGNWVFSGNVTAYGSPSDLRLKENIETIQNPLEKVQQLNGVTFNYKKDGKESTGLIAQDLEKVLPQVVYEAYDLETNETHKAVRYGNIVGLLVEAMKEQQKQIEELKEEVSSLRLKN